MGEGEGGGGGEGEGEGEGEREGEGEGEREILTFCHFTLMWFSALHLAHRKMTNAT